jgi:hypothetical protein
MLEIQKYLFTYGEEKAFAYFRDDLHLSVKEATDGCRVLFKYDMIDSPLGHPICQEARGLILDRRDNWKVISWPFKKFFNLGEGHAAAIDLSTARVLEKVDGTCITLYFWNGKWRLQTLGMIDGDGAVNNVFPPTTFAELFYRVLGLYPYGLSVVLNPKLSYTFELATPYNRIVTRYEKERIVLLSIRDMESLCELPDTEVVVEINYVLIAFNKVVGVAPTIELPRSYPIALSSLSEVADLAAKLPQMDEGYVVVDAAFNRVKVKNPSYLALLHLKEASSSSVKALVQLVLKNEGSEFLTYFPEFKEQYDRISAAVNSLKGKLQEVWDATKHIEVQKDFALAVTSSKVPFTGVLFNLRKGSIQSVSEGLAKTEPKHVVEALKLEVEEAKDVV